MKLYRPAIAAVMALFLSGWTTGAPKRHIPPPLRLFIPFEAGWKQMHETLLDANLGIDREDRAQGYIVSDFREYISGPLTREHIRKIGEPSRVVDGSWIKARYQFEILIELVQTREILVTVYANIEGLRRQLLGEEEWVHIPSNGSLEADVMTQFGTLLFGNSFALDTPKPGFWERDPSYVPDLIERIPRTAGPERHP